jgi:autotransporter-associated beta strand protein
MAACMAGAAAARSAFAATETWTGLTDVTWAGANWTPTGYVPTSGDTAVFNNAGNANTSVDLGAGVTIANILFDTSKAAAYNIGIGAIGSETLTLNNGGSITVNPSVVNNETFSSAITLGTDQTAQTYTVTNNSSDPLAFLGNITGAAGTGAVGVKTLTVGGVGNTTISGSLSSAAGTAYLALTKNGSGTLTLSGSNNYTGATTINGGTLELDFTPATAPATNIVAAGSVLKMNGGTLLINGNATNANSQTFAGTTFGTGQSFLNVAANGNSTAPTVNLGAITYTGYDPVQYSTTGSFTTSTAGGGPKGLMWTNYATYGSSDWAATNGTAITGLSSISGGYVTTMGGTGQNQNMDLQANYTATGNVGSTTIRFNTPAANTVNVNGKWIVANAILVTPNMGAVNSYMGGGNWYAVYNTNAATEWVTQNNPSAYLVIGSLINDKGGTGALTYVQSGPGTVQMPWTSTVSGAAGNSANNYTGQDYLNGGATLIKVDADLGAPGTGATVNLNGGSVVGDANVTLDNGAGAKARAVTIGANGGGLAAANGFTMIVDGAISGAGTLTVGIPPSSANGNTAGLLSGSGTGTANTTPVMGTGTVTLSSTGNSFTGGTVITGGAILNINSEWALGGSVYSGLTFSSTGGGTLQYASTLLNTTTDISQNSATTPVAQPVFLAGPATIDTDGHAVTYANPIGAGGSGGLTVVDSYVGTKGSLTLSGANSYTGATVINSGTLALASGATLATSGVTVNTGGTFLPKSTASVPAGYVNVSGGTLSLVDNAIGTFSTASLNVTSGSLSFELNNPGNSATGISDLVNVTATNGLAIAAGETVNLYSLGGLLTKFSSNASGPNPSSGATYDLINYTGTDSVAGGDSAINSDLTVTNKVAGLTYTFSDASNEILLTITGTPVTSGGWITDGGGSWTQAVNWSASPGTTPNSPGSTATLAGAAATHANLNRTVTLDGTETVGTLIVASPNGESYTINQGSGGSLVFDGAGSEAALTISSGTHTINAPMVLNSGLDVTVSSGATVSLNGNISNGSVSSTLIKDSTGTLVLAGSNSYGPAAGTVGTTINAGTVRFGNNLAFSTGDVSLTASTTLQAGAAGLTVANNFGIAPGVTTTLDNQGNTVTLSGVISGTGSNLTEIGTGTLVLSGSNTYTGATTVSAGTLQLGAGGTSGSVSGNIVNNAALTLNLSGTPTLANLITGTGTLTQLGSGNVTLTAANTYSGNTVVANGTLTLGNSLAIQNSTLNYNGQGGNLSFGTLTAATFNGLIGSQSLSLSNTATTPAGVALTLQGTTANLYTGTLSGLGSLIMNNTSTVTIGSNTSGGAPYTGGANYSGGTTVNSGTLVLGGAGNISSGTVDIPSTNAASNLVITDSAQVTSTAPLYIDDAPMAINGYPYSGSLTVKSAAQLTVGGFSIGNGDRVSSSTVTIQDHATMTVNGPFNLLATIGGTASTNTVNLNGGTLAVQNVTFTGGNGTTQLTNVRLNGGVLEALANDPATANPYFIPPIAGINLYVDAGSAIINTNGFSDTIASPLLHGTVITGGTTDGGLVKTGAGSLMLIGSSTYTGPTNVSAGSLVLGNGGGNGSLPIGSPITVNGSSTFAVNENGNVQQGSQFSTAPITGTGGFTQLGGGTTIFTAANAYTGPTNISSGTLQLGNNSNTGSISTSSAIVDNANLAFNRTDNIVQGTAFSTGISGSGTVTLNGPGSVTLNANNTYSGGTLLNSGSTLIVANTIGTSATGSGAVTVNTGATLTGGGFIGGQINLSGGTVAPGVAGTTLTTGGFNYSSGTLSFSLNGATGASSNISTGTAGFSGTPQFSFSPVSLATFTSNEVFPLLISATPLYDSGTNLQSMVPVSFGRLTVTPSVQTSGPLTGMEIIATVTGTGPANLVWAGNATGVTGTQGDGMTWNNTGPNNGGNNWNNGGAYDYFYDYDNVTFNDTGTPNYSVNISGTVSPGSITVNTSTGAGGGQYNFTGGSISGTGSLSVTKGTLFLNNSTNNYSGGTTISAGATIQTGNGQALLGTGTITVNGTLDLYGNSQTTGALTGSGLVTNSQGGSPNLTVGSVANTTFSGVIQDGSGNGTSLTKVGSGTLALTGSNTYSGQTTIEGGIVQINSAASLGNNTYSNNSIYMDANDGNVANVTLELTGNSSVDLGSARNIQLNGSSTFQVDGTGTLIVDGTINGSGPLIKTGSGTLVFTNSNNYNGATDINAGVLCLQSGNGLGYSPAVIVAPGAELQLSGGSINVGNVPLLTLNGSGVSGGGALHSINGSNGYAAAITLGSASQINCDAGTLALSGAISGPYGVSFAGAGTTTLSGASTFTGNINISTGTVIANRGNGNGAGPQPTSVGESDTPNRMIIVSNGGTLTLTSSSTLGAGSSFAPANYAAVSLTNATLNLDAMDQGGNTNGNNTVGALTLNGSTVNLQAPGDSALYETLGLAGSVTVTGKSSTIASTANGNFQAINLGIANPIAAGYQTNFNVSQTTGGTALGGTLPDLTVSASLSNGDGAGAAVSTGVLKNGAGTMLLSGIDTYTGLTTVAAGKLVLASATAFPSNAPLNVSSGATVQVAISSGNVSYVPILSSLANNGTVDITNNAMVIKNANASIGTLFNEVKAGYNGGGWNGTGSGVILSSTAAADATHLTAVGIATGLTSFQGAGGIVAVGLGDVAIKDTYYGDANLDGSVSSADYTLIDAGYLSHGALTGWQNGDFNYDGVINGSDYTLIDNAFNLQGAQISAQIASPSAQIGGTSAAVPEPTTLGLLAIGTLGLLGRRTSRRSR